MELDRRLEATGVCFEWAQIKQGIETLHKVTVEDQGARVLQPAAGRSVTQKLGFYRSRQR
jgi:hypothetical protein